MSRQQQMPHDHTLFHHSTIIKFRRSCLPDHFCQCFSGNFRTILCMRIFTGKIRLHVFKIRKINIHKSVKKLKHFCFLISAAVIYYRNRKSLLLCQDQCLSHLHKEMSCRHKINIIRLLPLQIQKNFRQTLCRDHFAALPSGDHPVLTEHTS